jgi:release factor glutamine methyltransferase
MENQEIAWLLKEKYQGVKNADFEADCARLAAGEPLGYLVGHVPFLDCTIHLDSHPLIPRVETEFWVEKAIAAIINSPGNLRGRTPLILDLCAGSGAIGVAVAKAVPDAQVTFAEIDEAHLLTIEKNLSGNITEYPNRLGYYPVIESDIFSNVSERFDFILTNPPYIDASAETVDTNVAAHEPHLALFGGALGMEIIERIISKAEAYLTPTGQLWIEHEPAQVEAITTLAHTHGFSCVTHPDQYNTPRMSVLSMAQ